MWLLFNVILAVLIHINLDKTATISQTIFSDDFCEWKLCILIQMSLKFVPKGPVVNNTALF